MKMKLYAIILIVCLMIVFTNEVYGCNNAPVADFTPTSQYVFTAGSTYTVYFDGSSSYDPDQGDYII